MEHRSLLEAMLDSSFFTYRPDLADCLGPDSLELLHSRYRFLDSLGGGSSGQVYKVADRERADQVVAVRVFRPMSFACTPADCVRLKRQLLPTIELEHPNIVTTLEIIDVGGNAYIVEMEYVDAEPLAAYMEPPDAGFALDEALPILHGVASGLAHAHSCAMTYLHLTPRNILITDDGTAKLADFGLTCSRRDVHTPVHCIAPECFCPGYAPDYRADIYSLGMLAFAMVAGRPAFDGPTWMHIVAQHLATPTPQLCDARQETLRRFQDFVCRCTTKAPGDRFATMHAATQELRQMLSDQERGLTARPSLRSRLFHAPRRPKTPRAMAERAHDLAKMLQLCSEMSED